MGTQGRRRGAGVGFLLVGFSLWAMSAGGLKCPVEKDLRADIWLKLLGNVADNPVSVLTRATMGEIAAHPGTRQLVLAMMREEYLKKARSAIGASTMPDGKAFYQAQIEKHTTLTLTPQQQKQQWSNGDNDGKSALRPGGCRSRDSEYGGESGEDEKGAHRCAPSSGGATAGTNSGRLSLGHVSNVLSRQASIGIGQVP